MSIYIYISKSVYIYMYYQFYQLYVSYICLITMKPAWLLMLYNVVWINKSILELYRFVETDKQLRAGEAPPLIHT